MDIEDKDGFTWETAYERTWEALHEDESGSLRTSVLDLVHQAKRRRLLDRRAHVRLGIMRHVYVVLDMSDCMLDKDMQPSRVQCAVQMLDQFIDEFFDQNPISQLGFITTRDKRAQVVQPLTVDNNYLIMALNTNFCSQHETFSPIQKQQVVSTNGNVRAHHTALNKLTDNLACSGEPSLQNALELAMSTLKHTPSHSSREVLFVLGSLTTCDPGNVFTTIETASRSRVQCSVLHLAADVHVFKQLTQRTGGTQYVITDNAQFKDVLFAFTLPPTVAVSVRREADSSMIRMGFPTHRHTHDKPSLCVCHPNDSGVASSSQFTAAGYFCPQCNSKYCSLPVECRVCGLTLVSAPQLARSYQHLTPLAPFVERTIESNAKSTTRCFSCDILIDTKSYECSQCRRAYCIDCDLLLHESLHVCPGCS